MDLAAQALFMERGKEGEREKCIGSLSEKHSSKTSDRGIKRNYGKFFLQTVEFKF